MFLRPAGSPIGGDIMFILPVGSCSGPPAMGGDIILRPTGSAMPGAPGGETVFARATCAPGGGTTTALTLLGIGGDVALRRGIPRSIPCPIP